MRLLGRGAADVRLRAGAKALGDLQAHLDDALGARQRERLGVGVGDQKSTPDKPGAIMLLTALPTAAAHAANHDAGLQFPEFGSFEIDASCLSLFDTRECLAARSIVFTGSPASAAKKTSEFSRRP